MTETQLIAVLNTIAEKAYPKGDAHFAWDLDFHGFRLTSKSNGIIRIFPASADPDTLSTAVIRARQATARGYAAQLNAAWRDTGWRIWRGWPRFQKCTVNILENPQVAKMSLGWRLHFQANAGK